jgi:adenosylhomocysteine nucleosidase
MFHSLLALIGIMSAMPQEAESILGNIEDKDTVQVGTHQFVTGTFEAQPVVFSLCGVGKVSAATNAALMIAKFGVTEIVFTGVAGGGRGVEIGDIVIGSTYLQHDLDPQPIFPPFYVYSLDKQLLDADAVLVEKMKAAADRFLQKNVSFPHLGIHTPQVHIGVIASGDQFISDASRHQELIHKTKHLLPNHFQAVEMEGAAVAQVCNELRVPFVVMRSISDKADHTASVDFLSFIDQVASHYSFEILKEYFKI